MTGRCHSCDLRIVTHKHITIAETYSEQLCRTFVKDYLIGLIHEENLRKESRLCKNTSNELNLVKEI